MVFAADVGLFMGDNMFQVLFVQLKREIDSWPDNAKYKGRGNMLTLEDIVPVQNGGADSLPQTPVADDGI